MKSESNAMPPTGPAGEAESAALRLELSEQKDRYLRLAADFENYRRRSRQEIESRAAAPKDAFMIELLPVIDNLERAVAAGTSRHAAQFHEGVQMTLRQLQQLLRQHGIESDDAIGQMFDPHRHEALVHGHDPAQPDHVVLGILQRGYHQAGKVIRPAKVTVNALTDQPGPDRGDPILETRPESERWIPSPGSQGRQAPESPSADEDDEGRSQTEQMVDKGAEAAERNRSLQASRNAAKNR